jgi:pantoate--beta-alanine ligase
MGALHAGHLSLVQEARRISDHVVVSVFVNPAQFGPNEDYQRYPRNLDGDLRVLKESGADSVFVPEAAEIYPQGFKTFVTVGDLGEKLCGVSRPGHFRGVATVVLKLLNIVEPEVSVFGQKDFQQCVLIRRMVRDLDLKSRVVVCPIVREDDGLALSSRNRYLSPEERKAAPILYHCLEWAQQEVEHGEVLSGRILRGVINRIGAEQMAKLDYAEIVNEETLDPDQKVTKGSVLAAAVWFGSTRLIDNVILKAGGHS